MPKNSLSLAVREQADRLCMLEDLNYAPVDLGIIRDFTDFCSPHILRSSAQEVINQMTFKLFTHPMTAFSVPDMMIPIARAGNIIQDFSAFLRIFRSTLKSIT
ncbi:hypothetical protein FD724_39105 (plasmid) [Nostoc sp. C057]|uniref:hypothetical protein n=1 Tax=Nostoc sp. C057 TaxID=2576903 RepID=UPI0015C2F4C3|nr:hypothetical protein [Nostoc sp. C057]QLE53846.1 hypothetical protein FD724_39105 [Nostoc sp. C057]